MTDYPDLNKPPLVQVFRTLAELQSALERHREKGEKIGFIPTMGALHEGHLSLIRNAKETTDVVVCSIFVNPTQFNNPKDLETYPRQLDHDVELLQTEACDYVWAPEPEELYKKGEKAEPVDYGALSSTLEGEFRPKHFDGVVTVVRKLFKAVKPDRAYFGEKDFQQLAIVRELQRREFPDVEVMGCPIIRSAEGLALSSRNKLLSEKGLAAALGISKVLRECASRVRIDNPLDLRSWGFARLTHLAEVEPEYLEVVSQRTLEPSPVWDADDPSIILMVAYVEGVRLLDNLQLTVES